MDWTLVVLAAGMGSRFGGLKQLKPVGPAGEVVLEYSVYDAWSQGCRQVVFVLRREMEQDFREQVWRRFPSDLEITCVWQDLDDMPEGFSPPPGRSKPWGTGHAVLAARKVIQQPFLVINADDFYGRAAYARMAEFWREHPPADPPVFALVSYRLADTLSEHGTVSRGVCRGSFDGRLTGITEMTRIGRDATGQLAHREEGQPPVLLTGEEQVSMNFWGFTSAFLPLLEERFRRFCEAEAHQPGAEFYLPYAVTGLVAQGLATVRLLTGGQGWFGLTYPEDHAAAVAAIATAVAQGHYPNPLWKSAP